MFLHSLKLSNIRSYSEQTITFPKGSILLSGDIGSGKSTLLQALEFALFGTSRPDLPAEALLRKGVTHAEVELQFSLQGKEIIIQRKLKKEKEGIKQLPGSITINNLKKELMPVELKAEMIALLGYPEDFITKNKNYLFRYTVYCPQEEMKFILQEDAEMRLDTLRKIFNLDKYRTIRENIHIFLKELRMELAVLETKTFPLPEVERQLHAQQNELHFLKAQLQELLPKKAALQEELSKQQQELRYLEQQQKQREQLQQQLRTIQLLQQEKQAFIQQLQIKILQLQEELQHPSFSFALKKEDLLLRLSHLELSRKEFLSKKATVQQKKIFLQRQIQEYQLETTEIKQQLALLPEKKQLKELLKKELPEKQKIEIKKRQLEELFLKINVMVSKNKTLLQQSQELQQNLLALEQCPTCLQQVTSEHKQHLAQQEQQKVLQAEQLLRELQQKHGEIMQQRTETEHLLQQLQQKEYLFHKIEIEIAHLQEKDIKVKQLQEMLEQGKNAYLALQQESETLKEETLQILENEIEASHAQIQIIFVKEQKEAQQKEVQEQIVKSGDHFRKFHLQQQQLKEMLLNIPETGIAPIQLQTRIVELLQQEKAVIIEETQCTTKMQQGEKQCAGLQEHLSLIQQEKVKLHQLQKTQHWLEQFFVPLTGTIEKHIMISIHRHFNGLFQEWFALLIDNEHMSARIDDAFTPIIEQDGYEIFFEHLSGGERTSAALAYRLALNRVINDVIHDIKTKELFILDEPTDGFSSEQLDKVREVLSRLQLQQLIIVSHESKIESFVDTVIRVQKEGNESRVVS